jgi:hypothetical protein
MDLESMPNDNDLPRAEQRDFPGGEATQESQRSWVPVVEAAAAGMGGAVAHDVYNDVKAAGKAIVDKFRQPPTPPPPPPSGDGGNET